ncbi:hypothetical protein J7I84_07355 [Arthrobacter sp. ISL-85]|uniref:hypothetical protein n=1 Tax=Arthrobacter sp. ISL-85 TaxID=2819115 RepID=UPI001BE6D141|nr:hypothetical protein [Arthrobacter sp. ISL-85]MBT2566312.1 hypothetical protein [Arthrobacter sp. ISL-85]
MTRRFGVEEEFLIVDTGVGRAVPLGEVLECLNDGEGLSSEMKQEQIEACTLPRISLEELAQDISARRKSAEVCHKRGKPLIVDEAWGAHLPFHPGTPTWAMSAGADVCVVSVHKMGLGFEQGSVFHLQGDLVDPVRLNQCADVLSTTSASTLLYAAMDGWRRQMVQEGKAMIERTLELTKGLRRDIEAIPGLHVLEDELVHAEASHDLDIQHVLIDVSNLGISGFQATDWLRENYRIDMAPPTTAGRRPSFQLRMIRKRPTGCWQRSGHWPTPPRTCPGYRPSSSPKMYKSFPWRW